MGRHVDFPAAGQQTEGYSIPILGWAIGRSSSVVAIEAVSDGYVVGRATVDQPRPDLAAAFPNVPDAGRCGFRTSVGVAGMRELHLELRAALRDQTRVPLATIIAKRRWPEHDPGVGVPLVSAVITAEEAANLAETLESVLEQTYPKLEVIVVNCDPSGAVDAVMHRYCGAHVLVHYGEEISRARKAGLAASRGAYLIFLEPGESLLPDALERATVQLTMDPSCAWVGAETGDGQIGGILFQRILLARRHEEAPLDGSLLERAQSGGHSSIPLRAANDRNRTRDVNDGRRSAPETTAAILLFHRVADLPSDPWGLSVSPEQFAKQLDLIRSDYQPLALAELVQTLDDGKVPERSVVITFDDGYADNLEAAMTLNAYDLPATFFLASGYIASAREFWWDELQRLLLQPGNLPDVLELELGGTVLRRELKGWMEYPEETQAEHRSWRAWDEPPTARHTLYCELYSTLQLFGEKQRNEALAALRSWAGQPPHARASHRVLTDNEVRALSRLAKVEIGAHTVTHPRLSSLPPAEQEREIVTSKQRLEEIVGAAVTSFAYPHGSTSDYGRETTELVEQAGFVCACAAHHTGSTSRARRFELPRCKVPAWWDSTDLAAHLDSWFER